MPEDFTEDMVSFLADEMEHPEITYYTNEKNAIAPKITDKAKTAVQQTVNTQFIIYADQKLHASFRWTD